MTTPPDKHSLEELVAFLCGDAPLDGHWFGEKPLEKPMYWWRKDLRAALSRTPSATAALDDLRHIAETWTKAEGENQWAAATQQCGRDILYWLDRTSPVSHVAADEDYKAMVDAWVGSVRDLARKLGLPDDESDSSTRDWRYITQWVEGVRLAKPSSTQRNCGRCDRVVAGTCAHPGCPMAPADELQGAGGTFACPICGHDKPHHHTEKEITAFREDGIRTSPPSAIGARDSVRAGDIAVQVERLTMDPDTRWVKA
jgi:hypothetical protein